MTIIRATAAVFLTICALALLPLKGQDDMGQQAPPPPSPENGPYVAPDGQGAPETPDQQGVPDEAPTDQAPPDQSASFQTFYDGLAPQGTWIQSSDYGYIWQPAVNDPDWAPYTNGHWVYADVGWTWVSDEPWGWATYHYGRWVNLAGTGWCWVPGYTWAPAWVSWRYGAGYCGWAPLPPASFVGIDYAGNGLQISAVFHIGGDCDSYYGIGAGWYHFVPVNYLGASNYRGYYVDRHDNYAIINGTTNVTNLNVIRNGTGASVGGVARVTTGGPSFAHVNAVSATPVQQVRLTRASQPGGGLLRNNSLALYSPHVVPVTGQNFQPPRVGGSLGQATVNRGVDITRPLAVNRSLPVSAPTPAQVQQARIAQSNVPAGSRVITASMPVNPVLQAPLTTFHPISVASPSHSQGSTVYNVPHSTSSPAAVSNSTVIENSNGASNYQQHVYQQNVYAPSAPASQGIPIVEHTTTNGSMVRSYVPTNYQNAASVVPSSSYYNQPQQVMPNGASNGSRLAPYNSQPSPGGNNNGGSSWSTHGGNGQNGNNQQQSH